MEYDYGELAPFIGARIMQLHHDKHHRAYIKNFNDALDQLEDVKPKSEEEKKRIDQSIRFNGGGHFNHSLFWQLLAPNGKGGGEIPPESSALVQAIISEWGSVKKFQESFNAKATGVQGSGWCWLIHSPVSNKLELITTPNQDQPQLYVANATTVLGIDVWEHAYYLDYENRRPDYLNQIWNVVHWNKMENLYSTVPKQ